MSNKKQSQQQEAEEKKTISSQQEQVQPPVDETKAQVVVDDAVNADTDNSLEQDSDKTAAPSPEQETVTAAKERVSQEDQTQDKLAALEQELAAKKSPQPAPEFDKDVKQQVEDKPKQTAKPRSTATTAEQPSAMPQKTKTGRGIAWFALIIALLGLGGLGYAMWYGYQYTQQQANIAVSLQQQQQEQALQISQLTQANQQLGQIGDQNKSAISQTNQGVQQQFEQVAQSIQLMQGRRPNDWLIAEAHFLVEMASRKLYLEHDHATAFTLLTDAQTRLNALADPSIFEVRRALASDIKRLQTVEDIDVDNFYLMLEGWSRQVEQLPFKAMHLPEPEQAQQKVELTESVDDWRSNLAATLDQFMQDFVTVRQHDQQIQALMEPEQQWFLKQNIRLKIQQAQLALMQQNQTVFESAIVGVQSLVSLYLDPNNQTVASMSSELNFLQGQNIQASLPVQLDSLSALSTLLNERIIGKPTGSEVMPVEQGQPEAQQ